MKVGDILEARSEEEFLVEVLSICTVFPDSFEARVISFPKEPKCWVYRYNVGEILNFDESDFKVSLRDIRDKKLKQLGL